jgi:hypothetical protein
MIDNPFFAELEKIANVAIEDGDEMNPDKSPKATEDEVAKVQAEKDEVKTASEVEEMREVLAAELPVFGTLAKLLELASGEESELQKEAASRLEYAFQSEDNYNEIIEKTASELFSNEDNQRELFTEEGIQYVVEKLASFVDGELEKVAFDVDSIVDTVKQKGGEFINKIVDGAKAVTGITDLQNQVDEAQNTLDQLRPIYQQAVQEASVTGQMPPIGLRDQIDQAGETVANGLAGIRNRQIGMGLGAAALAGGAIYGGKKLYDVTHPQPPVQEEQVASDDLLSRLEKTANEAYDENQFAEPPANPSLQGYEMENTEPQVELAGAGVPSGNPRQGARSVSNAPAGMDQTASEALLARLEKTANNQQDEYPEVSNSYIPVNQGAKRGAIAGAGTGAAFGALGGIINEGTGADVQNHLADAKRRQMAFTSGFPEHMQPRFTAEELAHAKPEYLRGALHGGIPSAIAGAGLGSLIGIGTAYGLNRARLHDKALMQIANQQPQEQTASEDLFDRLEKTASRSR